MKKIIFIIAITLMITSILSAQNKVTFSFQNARIESGIVLVDVYATVPSGQNWSVGPTNIRIRYWTENPPNAMTLITQDTVTNANVNLSNNNSYGLMTCTSILSDTSASLNILLLYNKPAYTFSPGSYWLGTLKFAITDPNACVNMQIYGFSAVFNDLTGLTYNSGWNKVDPPPCMTTGISQTSTELPDGYKLYQNYPNPFNPTTKIQFSLQKAGFVTLKVYDLLGREVNTLVNEYKNIGTYIVDFDALDLPSGVYFYRMESNGFSDVKKMLLLK
ncbi:MAG: T9SS type A sorting domain-containing protein [Ignavibacteria bacterium]